MKSWNDSKGRTLSRMGLLSLLALMILNLSTGQALAGVEDFKLWKRVDGKQVALTHLTDQSRIDNVTSWIVTDKSQAGFEKLLGGKPEASGVAAVPGFKDEPMQLMEGVLKAAKKSFEKKDVKSFSAFRDALLKNVAAVKGEEKWGKTSKGLSQESVLRSMIEKLLGKSDKKLTDAELKALAEKLSKMTEEEMLAELFNIDTRDKLALENTEEKAPVVSDADKKIEEALKKFNERLDSFEAKSKPVDTTSTPADTSKKPTDQAAAASTAAPAGPAAPPVAPTGLQRGVGELDDSAIAAKAQEYCDKFKKLQDDTFQNLIKPAQDAIAALVGQVEGQSRRPGIEQRRNDVAQNDGNLNDILGRLVSDLNGNKNANQFQQQPITPPAPIASTGNKNRGDGVFNQPIPEKQEQQDPGLQPLDFGPQQTVQQPIEVNMETGVPIFLGKQELAEARQVKREFTERTSPTKRLSQYSNAFTLGKATYKLEQESKRYGAAASNARAAADDITEKLQALTNDIEQDETALERKEAMKQQLAKLEREVEAEQQQAKQIPLQNTPEVQAARAAAASSVAQKKQQLAAIQQDLGNLENKLKTETAATKKKKKQEAAGLQQRAVVLNKEAAELEKIAGEVKGEYELVSEMYTQRKDYENSLAMGQGTQPAGSQNIYQRMGGQPRAATPTRVGSTVPQSGQVAGGGEIRKPLSGIK